MVVVMKMVERKPNRLQEYNYNQDGAYFITICTKDRRKVLSTIVGDDAHIVPKRYGEILEKYIKNVPEIEKYIIMPDHVHMIIRLQGGAMWASPPTKNDQVVGLHVDAYMRSQNKIASIVRSLKILTTKEIGESIFQRSYYDHVIRNQQDYNTVWEYIENNPLKWKLMQDCER